MIVILGTSNSVGGHDKNHTDPDIMLHRLLGHELGCKVLNLATPGRSTERYTPNLIYAYDKYKPSLVLCELFVERSYSNFWYPTNDTVSLSRDDAVVISQSFIEERFSWKEDRIDNRYINSRVNRNSKSKEKLEKLKNCLFQFKDADKILEYYNKACIYLDDDNLCDVRTIESMYTLELLAKNLGINILYFSIFGPAIEYNKAFIDFLPPERLINNYYNLIDGFEKKIAEDCNGKYLSHDSDHFNERADRILIQEYIAPYVRFYAEKYQLEL